MKGSLSVLIILIWLFAVIGWVNNIITLCSDPMGTGMLIARAIGIFMAPLGMVLGYI